MVPAAIIIWLVIGGIAGWIAGLIMKSGSFGIVGNVVVGIVGAAIAGFALPAVGIFIGGGLIAAIVNAVIGACLLLFVLRLIR